MFFFFNDTATTEIYTLSLHDALPISLSGGLAGLAGMSEVAGIGHQLQRNLSPGYGYTAIIVAWLGRLHPLGIVVVAFGLRSEEHKSELQSRQYLVCRLLLEKKKKNIT